MIEPGTRAPDFTLEDQDGNEVSLSDFAGRNLILAFYPLDFSPTCTDQLSIYQEVLGEIEDRDASLVGVSVDSYASHGAFREKIGISMPLLADFHPKGAVCEAYGAYLTELGHANRSLVLVGPDGIVLWSHATPTPLEIPGREPDLRRARSCRLRSAVPGTPSLGSAAIPEPDSADHVRGSGPPAIVYLDLACPRCAGSWAEIRSLPIELCVRHFPVASRRPRSPALHAAAEAVALQSEERFWEFWDSLLADRAHVDDPHLWERVRGLGLDLDRFQHDRSGEVVTSRLRRDFISGIRGGVTSTPAGFAGGEPLGAELAVALRGLG